MNQPHTPPDGQEEAKTTESGRLETRLGRLAWRSSGQGPALVFFAGALANGDLWRDVVVALEDHYRCITIDLPLGAHRWPLSQGADRSATSLARLLLDCLELLEVEDATVVANDTAGGLLLLSLATGHPALERVGRLVLTNCENYDQFPPDKLRMASAMCRRTPRLARAAVRLQLRSPALRRRGFSAVAASALDDEREESFSGPARRDPRVCGDLVAALAGERPQLLIDAAETIPRFDRPVLVIWGESCGFFPMTGAQRLASDFPHATLVTVPGAKTWIPVDKPAAVADAIAQFVPTSAGRTGQVVAGGLPGCGQDMAGSVAVVRISEGEVR
ncbi:MAG TPA: alpha/beta hydrolase [Streptosporangiaceae bacterium]|nr:alpha/beta hydrolase [Streptosporangiaceae bacterium]